MWKSPRDRTKELPAAPASHPAPSACVAVLLHGSNEKAQEQSNDWKMRGAQYMDEQQEQ
jgi:hypothetical protein